MFIATKLLSLTLIPTALLLELAVIGPAASTPLGRGARHRPARSVHGPAGRNLGEPPT